jgi:type I restriction enzyme, S subunit
VQLTSENVGWGKILQKDKYVPEAFNAKLRRSALLTDDLLINLVGASIGRAALMVSNLLPANINQAVAVVTLDKDSILPQFALQQILSPHVQRLLLGEIVEGARANISLTNIRELKLLVPPIETQRQFVGCVDSLNRQISLSVEAHQLAETAFSSLQSRAFSGEL